MPEPGLLLLLLALLPLLLKPMAPRRLDRQGEGDFPYATVALLLAQVAAFVAASLDPAASRDLWGLVAQRGRLQALPGHLFLHDDLAHLLGNMAALWLVGPRIERALGRWEYLFFYLGAGMFAGLWHVLTILVLSPSQAGVPLIGASGAVFGLLGLFAIRFWRTRVWVAPRVEVPAAGAVVAFVALQLVALGWNWSTGHTDHVSYSAHLGGFSFGAMLAGLMRMGDASRREYGLESALAASEAGHWDLAAAHYRHLLSRDPGDASLHHRLGEACCRLGQIEAAQRHYRDALQAHLRADAAPLALGVYEEALSALGALQLTPALLARLASACEELQRFQLATAILAQLAREHPQTPDGETALLRLGKLHLHKLQQSANAAGILAEFLRLYPSSVFADHARHLLSEAERNLSRTSAPQT